MKITIEVIPHEKQRYPTVGDWFWGPDGTHRELTIRVSMMSDWRYEMLVAVHELVEVLLCRNDGVTQKAVDRFDIAFEKRRKPGNTDEPGDDPRAPYRRQHCIATGVERVLAACLGVNWRKYEDEINAF